MLNDVRVQILLAFITSGVFTTLLNRFFLVRDRKKEKDSATTIGIRTLLQVDIRKLCEDYISAGEIRKDDLEDIIQLWKVYHEMLGGNGYLDAIMKRIQSLPIKV